MDRNDLRRRAGLTEMVDESLSIDEAYDIVERCLRTMVQEITTGPVLANHMKKTMLDMALKALPVLGQQNEIA